MTATMSHPLKLIALASLLGTCAFAQQVNIALQAGQLYNADGIPLAHGSLVLLLADTGNNGFETVRPGSLTVGSFVNDDDQVIGWGTIDNEFTGLAEVAFDTGAITLGSGLFSNLKIGDALATVWFPDLTGDTLLATVGLSYGLFTTTTPQDDSNAWMVPELIDSTLRFLTSSLNSGSYAESYGYASYTVAAIPEPSTYATLFGLAALGFAARRRFRSPTKH
jgi:PEP-CTERM putative exosortase interaction domain